MRKRLILALAVFVLTAAAATAVIWTQVIPQYRAEAEVRIRAIIPRLVFSTEDNGLIPLYQSFVNTQVSVIRSLPVLQRVLDQPQVQKTQWYETAGQSLAQRAPENTTIRMKSLRDNLSVRPRPQTEIIDVAFLDSSAAEAAVIVNAVVDQYIKYVRNMSDATKDELYRQLTEQYKTFESEILGRGTVIAALRRELGTGTPEELISARRIRLDETQASLSTLLQSIAVLEWDRKELEDLMNRNIAEDSNVTSVARTGVMQEQPKYYKDAEWRKLDIDVRTIRHDITVSELDPNDSLMVRTRKDLKFAEELLRLRETQLAMQWRDRLTNAAGAPITVSTTYEEQLRVLEHQIARANQEVKLLEAEYDKQQAEFRMIFESAQLLEKENSSLSHKRELFDAVRRRLDQKNMERNVPGAIEVLTAAMVPTEPHSDRRVVFTAIALLLSLGMSGGAALLCKHLS